MAAKIARVLGPYANGGKWRLVVFDEKGQRMARLAETKEEAEQIKASLLRLFDDRSLLTIEAAFEEWLGTKRQAGHKPRSIDTIERRLRPFLPLEITLGELTPQRAAELYLEETQRSGRFGILHACTHHKTLLFAKGFFTWAVDRGYVKANPFARVKPIGKANAGKPQLREDEARKLYALCMKLAQDGDSGAFAIIVQLVLALRSAEVLGLRARDLDAGGTVLVVDGTKTKNSKRRLRIESDPVRALLAERCAKLRPEELLFPDRRGGVHRTDFLYKVLRRLCEQAGVPIVCPHSLRGLHSSLAVAHGESSRAVAQALGHGSDAVTKKHYITSDALETARSRRVLGALEGPSNLEMNTLAETLARLSPDQLSALMNNVAERQK
jgi:integrase